jgi:hypothetical protein
MAHPRRYKSNQNELITLEEAWFSFDYLHRSNARNLFGSQSSCLNNSHVPIAVNCPSFVRPSDASYWPTTHGGKKVKWPSILKWHNSTPIIGRLASCFYSALFSPLLMSPHLGTDKFIIFFQMTSNIMWLLAISLDVHVSTLWQCWQVL